jgi:asparagine synthase (glutamine-hydrolysing)
MCGFAGFIDFNKREDLKVLKAMADTLVHRGPDDSGYEFLPTENAHIGFGFRRLSIIDLSPLGHQPMYHADGRLLVMLNGEIYNYQELRKELIDLGHSFRSNSDTEVILNGYKEWGISVIEKFIGMFSIALFDDELGKIFLVRDRAGVKPLFYYKNNGVYLFASELKAFHQCASFEKELNKDALALYFKHGNIPAPYCIFNNTYKINPGHWLCIDLKSKKETSYCYWNAFDAYNQKTSSLSYEDAKVKTEELMESAFNYRMVADVPVGVFLSGGYDSTAVAALLSKSQRKINTYTIGFESKDFDESKEAKKVANHLGTNHHEYICKMTDAMDIIPMLPDLYDEPFGDSSAIPTTLVSRIARQYVTVALSADAGDELFAGYPRHQKGRNYLDAINKIPSFLQKVAAKPTSLISNLISSDFEKADKWSRLHDVLNSKDSLEAFNHFNETFSTSELDRLLIDPFQIQKTVFNSGSELKNTVSNLNKILAVEYKTYLVDDILQKVDRATMSASLEGREPFLDHRLLEFVATLPDEYKLFEGKGKRILKDIVHQYVPMEIMNRPKMGFGVPVKDWLRVELKDLFIEVMDHDLIVKQNLFNPELVKRLKDKFLEGKLHDTERIWFLFVFQLWYKRWM